MNCCFEHTLVEPAGERRGDGGVVDMDTQHVVAGSGLVRPASLPGTVKNGGQHVSPLDPEIQPLREGLFIINKGKVIIPYGTQPDNQPGDDDFYVAAVSSVPARGRYLVWRQFAGGDESPERGFRAGIPELMP